METESDSDNPCIHTHDNFQILDRIVVNSEYLCNYHWDQTDNATKVSPSIAMQWLEAGWMPDMYQCIMSE